MQNAGLQYGEGVTPLQGSPFGVASLQNNGTTSSTSSLRQFRKKENVDKTSGAAGGQSSSSSRTDLLNSSHVARVAPHNHYPHKQNEYFRYPPQYQEYSPPYKEHTVKYSEIAEPAPQAIPHLEHLPSSVLSKHKDKDYVEMCNIPQQPHLNKPFPEHQYNGQQNYPTEMTLHHQYMQKEPQGPQMHSPYKPESQYIPKEGAFNHQISPFLKYNIPTQSRNYGHLENSSLGSFQRMDPHIARSLMSEHPHIRDFPAEYGAMEQSRMYAQKQRYYAAPLPPTNPTYPPNYPHRNMPTQQYNYPNCSYPRTAQVNSSMGRYPMNMERSMSPRRAYPENLDMAMNFPTVPQKISSTYPNYPAYAQHYQHRRPSAVPQDYYHPQQHHHARTNPQYMPAHHPQEVAENHVASNNIRQYLENWAEEESTADISPQIDNPKYIPRVNRDEANEVYVINASELPQYLEGGVPLVTSENGQYIFKSNVSIDNTGAIKILEKTVENAVLPSDAQERVVSLHIIENPKADCLINARNTNINQEHPGNANQVPATTIDVIASNNNHANQEHTVQHPYNVATSTYNGNRMNLMHHISPINHNGPQHYENTVNLCLHPNTTGENHTPSQQTIAPNSAAIEHNSIRLSPHIQPIEKSIELTQKVQNNIVGEGITSDKNRLKIQVLSYQEVPQSSCIVMPSTQNRLNFDESLLPNQVPSDDKGVKSEFEVRNDDRDENSTINNVISSNENILNEAHEELDKIVEDTLTSSNISIPLVNCERNNLPKIQEKCDTSNTGDNSRIPDDLNLDLESSQKDMTNGDYTMESSCNQENEDIMDLSTSRRGSKNDNDEQEIQSIELDLSISSVHNKTEPNVPATDNNLTILTEYSTATNEDVTTNNNSEEKDATSPKSSMKHMPLIDDNLEARATPVHSEAVEIPDIETDPKESSEISKPDEQQKDDGSTVENETQEKQEPQETDLSMITEIPLVPLEICDTSKYTSDCFPESDTREDTDINNSLDTALEAKLSEIVGEPYQFPEKACFIEDAGDLKNGEEEQSEQDDKSDENIDWDEGTNAVSEETAVDSSGEVLKDSHDQVVEDTGDVLDEKTSPHIENINENPSSNILDDTSLEKNKEGSRKKRIFSVDDIIYRIGPNTVQNRRESIHSIPDIECTVDLYLEEPKVEESLQQVINQAKKTKIDSDISVEKTEKTGTSSEPVYNSSENMQASENEQSSNEDISLEIRDYSEEVNTVEEISDCNSNLNDEIADNSLSATVSSGSRPPCNVDNMILEEEKPNSTEAAVLVENMTPSSHREIAQNVDKPEENFFTEEVEKIASPEENKCAETVQSDDFLSSEVNIHLLASEDIISVDRTSEFESSVESNSSKREAQDNESRMDISDELPLFENNQSKEMEVSENQEFSGNIVRKMCNECEFICSPEMGEYQNDDSSNELGLIIPEPSDVKMEDNSEMDCTKDEDAIYTQNERSEISNSNISEVELEDEAENVCYELEDAIANQKEDCDNKESKNTTIISSDISSDVRTENNIENYSKTEKAIENNLQSISSFPVCRFSVIHKIEDSTRVIHQEEIRSEDKFEASISKIDVSNIDESKNPTDATKATEQKDQQKKISTEVEIFTEEKVMPNDNENHCSVIHSTEDTLQDEINRKLVEKTEREDEERSSEKMEEYIKINDIPNENLTNTETQSIEIPNDDACEKPFEQSEKLKCPSLSSILIRKEELSFEQKFIEPFCNKNEDNIQKLEDIEEKFPEDIQYRNVLKIEENNVILEIGGELVEITVNQVNGKSVITVIPLSNTATVDFNDNYEHIDKAQLCEGLGDAHSQEDVRDESRLSVLLEDTREELNQENVTKEEPPELVKIMRPSEDDCIVNRSEDISSTQSESIGEIFEDIILNENEIIIGDESLEEEINLDLQTKEVVEEEQPKAKPALCTKAAKKLYDDIALHIPTKTYSSLREFRRIKSKPDMELSLSEFGEEDTRCVKKKARSSSKRSLRMSARKRTISEQKEGPQTALRELIERRKMRKEKIRLKYTQYAKQESRIVNQSIMADSLKMEDDEEEEKKVPMVPSNVIKMERLAMSSDVKKVKSEDEVKKRREFKNKMYRYKEKIRKKPIGEIKGTVEQSDSVLQKDRVISSNLEIDKKKAEEKPTSTSVIVSSSISTVETSPKNFHEVGTTTAKEICKNLSSQDKTPKFPKISKPRDLSLTKNVNEHYLSRKDHSNLKKKLSIQEYNSRKRKSGDCKGSLPEKSVKLTDEVVKTSMQGGAEGVAKPSTIYSDRQFECLTTSVKDPRRRPPHLTNMQPAKVQRTLSEDPNTSQTQSISSSRPNKSSESPQLYFVEFKDPLLNSNESYVREVQNYKNYKTLLLGKSSEEKYIPKPMKLSNRRKTIEVMNDRKIQTDKPKKKVSFDDNVQINEINTTQSRMANIKPEITNYCEVSSSCSDIFEDKNSEDSRDHTNEDVIEEINKNMKNVGFKLEERRRDDWEDSNSPKDSITDVFAESFLEKAGIENLKNKGKLFIDISDFDTSPIDNELKSPCRGCSNGNTPTYEETGSLKNYKEEVDSKLNSLNIHIPKTPKSRTLNEDDVLIHKFLRKEQLNSEEIKQIRRIIYFKKKIQQLTHQNLNTKNENDSYEVKKNLEHSEQKDLKLQLKKIDGRPKKKKRRFRNLYSDSPDSSEGDVQGTAGEFSVYEGENMSGVKLIFRRKTDLLHLQPVVRLQRCKYIESMAKKIKFE